MDDAIVFAIAVVLGAIALLVIGVLLAAWVLP